MNVTYYRNGKETKQIIKYSDESFSVRVTGETDFFMHLYDENGKIGIFPAENGEIVFPSLNEGIYWFDIITEFSLLVTGERLVSVHKKYISVIPPRGAMYHIFVDRFRKGGDVPVREDAVMNDDWENGVPQYAEHEGDDVENNMFFGGTIYGIIEKLDYIKSLGAEWLYLSPIFTAYSNHKYDTCDFLTVDEMFGGRDALDKLIKECHIRGMKIILDGVFNHVGRDSIYFDVNNKCGGAYKNLSSPYRSWFDIHKDGTYDCWWGLTNLPKVIKNDSYRSFICKKVIPEYMKAGIDGWRLDVVDEYSNDFLEEITAATKKRNPNAIVLGEVWDDVTDKVAYSERKKYFCGSYLDSAMNYPIRSAMIEYFKNGNGFPLKETLENQIRHYPKENLLAMMNFLGTHDTERILTVLGDGFSCGRSGNELANMKLTSEQREKAVNLLSAAYTMLACLPGFPSIFYGDEAGMEGYRDPFNRRTFPWGKEDKALTECFRKANQIRASHDALVNGDTEVTQCNDGFFVFKRYNEKETIYIVANLSAGYDYIVGDDVITVYGEDGIVRKNCVSIYQEKRK